MARITVEDCLERVPNVFELVLIATRRARQLSVDPGLAGVPWDRDKAPVVALREVAAGVVGRELLEELDTPDPRPTPAYTVPTAPVYGVESDMDVDDDE